MMPPLHDYAAAASRADIEDISFSFRCLHIAADAITPLS
jgi:hypothetical protein